MVDMLDVRDVKRIIVENRTDCCQDRGLPMIVELRGADGTYVEVARRTTPFDTWEPTISFMATRYVRIRAEGKTFLHLREIDIP